MIDSVYDVIDKIEESTLVKDLKSIKSKINSNSDVKKLISNFEDAKNEYNETGITNNFIKAKEALMKNELISRYLNIQNEINLLILYINKKIGEITKDTIHHV